MNCIHFEKRCLQHISMYLGLFVFSANVLHEYISLFVWQRYISLSQLSSVYPPWCHRAQIMTSCLLLYFVSITSKCLKSSLTEISWRVTQWVVTCWLRPHVSAYPITCWDRDELALNTGSVYNTKQCEQANIPPGLSVWSWTAACCLSLSEFVSAGVSEVSLTNNGSLLLAHRPPANTC